MVKGLGPNAFVNNEIKREDYLVDMFHADLDVDEKRVNLLKIMNIDSQMHCMIATKALGVGVDIPDIKHIIHWGCPASILQYWQEEGRASLTGMCNYF